MVVLPYILCPSSKQSAALSPMIIHTPPIQLHTHREHTSRWLPARRSHCWRSCRGHSHRFSMWVPMVVLQETEGPSGRRKGRYCFVRTIRTATCDLPIPSPRKRRKTGSRDRRIVVPTFSQYPAPPTTANKRSRSCRQFTVRADVPVGLVNLQQSLETQRGRREWP
jgi:hypothetical protein